MGWGLWEAGGTYPAKPDPSTPPLGEGAQQLGRRSGQIRSRQGQWQRSAPTQQVCKTQPLHHQHLVQDGRQIQDHLDAPEFKTLSHDRFHHCTPTRHQGRPGDPCHKSCWMLDQPQADQGCTDAAPHRNRPKTVRASKNVTGLKNPIHLAQFQEALENLQDGLTSKTSSEKCSSFNDTIAETAKEVLGAKTRTHEDWFNENDEKIREALHAKNKFYIEWQNDPSSVSKREDSSPSRQKTSPTFDWCRTSGSRTKQLKSSTTRIPIVPRNSSAHWRQSSAPPRPPLLASDGSTLIKDQEDLSKYWQEHFSNLINRPSSVDTGALSQIPQQPIQDSLAEPPTMDEIKKAIHQTSSGRASGKDGIPAKIYKAAGPNALEAFHDVLLSVWKEEKMPDDFRDALHDRLPLQEQGKQVRLRELQRHLTPLYRRKDIYQSYPQQTHHCLRAEPPRGAVWLQARKKYCRHDFSMRQLQEKCIEQNMPLF